MPRNGRHFLLQSWKPAHYQTGIYLAVHEVFGSLNIALASSLRSRRNEVLWSPPFFRADRVEVAGTEASSEGSMEPTTATLITNSVILEALRSCFIYNQ